ncbi:MAG: hypothetical protein ACJ731_10625 [Vicinamibacterales bacterium]
MQAATDAVDSVVHRLYGIRIRTPWPVRGATAYDEPWDVEFAAGRVDTLARAASFVPADQNSRWAQYAALPDGSAYRRWTNFFEFLVTADARRIYARALSAVDREAMLAYLLVDALSFSMVRLGREPLHATAVSTDRGVLAFLGNSGDGKSTLAALLLSHGCKLVTDDMLILTRAGDRWQAQPGPPRLKLYRDMADRVLGPAPESVPMNRHTTKLVIPLDPSHCATAADALTGIYILADGADAQRNHPVIQRLSPAAALPRVLAHTAAHYPSEAARLKRQFEFATTLVREIPIKTIAYRREQTEMSALRDAVLADVARRTA